MKKQQYILVSGALIFLVLLFFFGNTIPPKKPVTVEATTPHLSKSIETDTLLLHAKERLTPQQLQKITSIENSVIRGDVKAQQINAYKQLATFWRDSIRLFEPYAWYTAQAAKLESSEKTLTFAAHLFLGELKTEANPEMQHWLATNAKDLFELDLAINPANDSSKVGLGACYIFGNISDNPMDGIGKIREVSQRNPNDLFAHFMLGLGGIKSGQFDKAIEHFKIIAEKQPGNMEAMLNLAECYEQKNDKPNAVKWYKAVRDKVTHPDAKKALDERIRTLEK